MNYLLGFVHSTSRGGTDWMQTFREESEMWQHLEQHLIVESRPWDPNGRMAYQRWYWEHGASNIPVPREQAVGEPRESTGGVPVSEMQYRPIAPVEQRIVSFINIFFKQ